MSNMQTEKQPAKQPNDNVEQSDIRLNDAKELRKELREVVLPKLRSEAQTPETPNARSNARQQGAKAKTETLLDSDIKVELNDGLTMSDLESAHGMGFVRFSGKLLFTGKAEQGSATLDEISGVERIELHKTEDGVQMNLISKSDRADGSALLRQVDISDGKYQLKPEQRRINVPLEAEGMSAKQRNEVLQKLEANGVSIDLGDGTISVENFVLSNGEQQAANLRLTASTQTLELSREGDTVKINIVDMPNEEGIRTEQELTVQSNGEVRLGPVNHRRQEENPEQSALPETLEEAAQNEKLRFAEDAFEGKNVTEIWNRAFTHAKKFAESQGYTLHYTGTGARAKSITAETEVDPIELQEIWAVDAQGNRLELGVILPEARHLTNLKSSADLYREMTGRLQEAVKNPDKYKRR